jgi:hypothetical protein
MNVNFLLDDMYDVWRCRSKSRYGLRESRLKSRLLAPGRMLPVHASSPQCLHNVMLSGAYSNWDIGYQADTQGCEDSGTRGRRR